MQLLKHGCRILRNEYGTRSTRRHIASVSKTWDNKYKKATRIELEKYWKDKLQKRWDNRDIQEGSIGSKPKFYCLSMFPYPSGRLHMGHVRVYTISDTFAHFYRMNGYNVIHPMGWDAFGLPAENAARDRKLDPVEWTKSNISYMREQLKDLNLTFDWQKEFSTCDSSYYKWTQFIFTKLFEAGLAYQKEALVNWDPVDKTVLADEQVDENGCSWRSGAKVEQKYLKQWFFKASDYAESLLSTLDEIDEEVGIKATQRNWIGNIDGCYINLLLVKNETEEPYQLQVFCTNPEAIYGSSHVAIQSNHLNELAHQLGSQGNENMKTFLLNLADLKENAIIPGCYVMNPISKKKLPVMVTDEFEAKFTRPTAILCIPNVCTISEDIAQKHEFTYQNVMDNSGQTIVNSNQYSGLSLNETRSKILHEIKHRGIGNGKMTSSRLCDWLISRQRYWGTPIPIIHCPTHGPVPVPSQNLPVELPQIEDLSINSGVSPLGSVLSWVNTTCPKCSGPAKRETDTMDTFVDSSWYFLRYSDPCNTKQPFDKDIADKTMPVDLYIGGKEHATLHLYYARFFSHFLADLSLHSHREPFKKILAQGIIKGLTHQVKSTGKYIPASEVTQRGNITVVKDTDEPVECTFQKMSKSKLNGIDPEDFVNEWGISITRLYVLYAASPFEDIHWDVKTDVIPGVMRWQLKLWTCVTKLLKARTKNSKIDIKSNPTPIHLTEERDNLVRVTNKAIIEVTNHYKKDCVLSAAITCLMTLAKTLFHASDEIICFSPEFERAVCAMVFMSAPMVPHFASELWSGVQLMPYTLTDQPRDGHVLDQHWPEPKVVNFYLEEFKVQVNNRTCHSIRLPSDVDYDLADIKSSLLSHKKIKKRLKGAEPDGFSLDKDKFIINISSNAAK